jgi:hypothetical protein
MWRYFTLNRKKRYVDVLQNVVQAYNHSYRSAIKMTPIKALTREKEAWRNFYENKLLKSDNPKLSVGDHVRISREKGLFEKGFEHNWSREIFLISGILRRDKVVYTLTDLD